MRGRKGKRRSGEEGERKELFYVAMFYDNLKI